MNEVNTYKIRPAGRHLSTIGEDLIQDNFAAIVELVKNAYDADSPEVTITFKKNSDGEQFQIIVEDHGHGMSRNDVIHKWMVPSTSSKVAERISPKGRLMQGRKGIGRYAASILGQDILLETVTPEGEKTTLYIEWSKFNEAEYLDQVDVIIESEQIETIHGTRITINGNEDDAASWNERQFHQLKYELKRLIPADAPSAYDRNFEIFIEYQNFFSEESKNIREKMESYPILDMYDYRIFGVINSNGKARLTFENRRARNTVDEVFEINLGQTNCGDIEADIRVYDRDPDAIDQLIARGLYSEGVAGNKQYVSKNQAKKLLNDVNGIGVYRNGFRIRPLGDADYDWLKLNEARVQNPSLKISSNQVVGYIHIQSEELSGLEEKSARDGLKDNIAFKGLKNTAEAVLLELETRRFQYRRKLDLSRTSRKVEKEFEKLYDFDSLKKNIGKTLADVGISAQTIEEVKRIIDSDQNEKNKAADEIRQAIAIYQGQATVGKIINIVLHEGRRPLNYFKNQIKNLRYWSEKFEEQRTMNHLQKVLELSEGYTRNAEVFVELFGRIDPLASRGRDTKEDFSLMESIKIVKKVFENELERNKIHLSFDYQDDVRITGWSQDMYVIFTNLIDNSIYWIQHKRKINNLERVDLIQLKLKRDGSVWELHYTDSGTGIEPHMLDSGVIFDPDFSTKKWDDGSKGSGLGLAIAGEAAQRNNLELLAVEYLEGAHFILRPVEVEMNNNE